MFVTDDTLLFCMVSQDPSLDNKTTEDRDKAENLLLYSGVWTIFLFCMLANVATAACSSHRTHHPPATTASASFKPADTRSFFFQHVTARRELSTPQTKKGSRAEVGPNIVVSLASVLPSPGWSAAGKMNNQIWNIWLLNIVTKITNQKIGDWLNCEMWVNKELFS